MSEDLVKMMEKKSYSEIVEKITNSLKRFGMTTDFEAIYTIVEGLTNLKHAVKNNGPFTAYVCKDLKDFMPKQNLKDLLQVFKEYLLEECKLKRVNHIKPVYDKLFQITKDSGAKEKRYPVGTEDGKEPFTVNVGYTIATTNYDMILESYHWKENQEYADGFRQTKNPQIKELDLTTYSQIRQRWLIKIHGSIWQYRYGDSIFKTNDDPKKLTLPIKIQEEMMIYPTGEKPILRYPYYDFYNVFKMQRWQKLIVIGYSFRDDPVNTAIIENLEKTKHSILIVVNPNPKKVIQNVGALASSKFDDRVIPVNGKFGDEKVFKKLVLALKVENKPGYFKRAMLDGYLSTND